VRSNDENFSENEAEEEDTDLGLTSPIQFGRGKKLLKNKIEKVAIQHLMAYFNCSFCSPSV